MSTITYLLKFLLYWDVMVFDLIENKTSNWGLVLKSKLIVTIRLNHCCIPWVIFQVNPDCIATCGAIFLILLVSTASCDNIRIFLENWLMCSFCTIGLGYKESQVSTHQCYFYENNLYVKHGGKPLASNRHGQLQHYMMILSL